MKFENTEVCGFATAFRGMRNPLNSWSRSDSYFGLLDIEYDELTWELAAKWAEKELGHEIDYDDLKEYDTIERWCGWLVDRGVLLLDDHYANVAYLGPNDLDLAQRLIKAGPEHAKFLRQIYVGVDITGPLFWWKEADTYKVGTTANSTSTMHKLATTPIDLNCFETDDMEYIGEIDQDATTTWDHFDANDFMMSFDDATAFTDQQIQFLEELRLKYLETKDVRYWKELVRWLPESWLQKRTWTANYAILRNIYHQRKNHKLSEWHSFCDWVKTLPYAAELITIGI